MRAAAAPSSPAVAWWPAAVVWACTWLGLLLFDRYGDLAHQALILVLAAAVSALWLSWWVGCVVNLAAMLAFNFHFVPPTGSFAVDLHAHSLLIATMLAVSTIVALLMTRQRRLLAAVREQAFRAEQLRSFGDALRDVDDPRHCGELLRDALSRLTGGSAALLLPAAAPANAPIEALATGGSADQALLGQAGEDERSGLRLSLNSSRAMGPGTGRHDEQAAWYLPMRGRHASFGAALLRLPAGFTAAEAVRAQAQALCDQMGAALDRFAALQAAQTAQAAAQAQALRSTLLTAISHDHRTPLATILGAASALHDQEQRLSGEQRRRLAATIVDEAGQLARLTENTLQLARLDAPGITLHLDWESVEEIVGTVLRRVRQRDAGHAARIRTLLAPGLPLMRCDATLLVQMLDNLVDNALKYGGEQSPIEIAARRDGARLLIAVRDRGPGVPPAWRSRIFDTFQRGDPAATGAAPRGAGIGLAVCRAIAQAHAAELVLRSRRHGGASFEFIMPVGAEPDAVEPDAAGPDTAAPDHSSP
ncbi:MAG: ATP-binding protein [Burkholderiaceae bacterium]